jgi:hypothetical protein
VDVLERDDERPGGRDVLDEAADGGEDRVARRAEVGLLDAGMTEEVAQRQERDALAVGRAAADQDGRPARARDGRPESREQLADEPRLADAGVADERQETRAAAGRDVLVERPQPRELRVASDERRVVPPQERGRFLVDRLQPERRERLARPFQLERPEQLAGDGVRDERVRVGAEQDLPRAGGLLQALADVDGLSRDEGRAGGRVARDDLPGVDADPKPQLRQPRSDRLAQLRRRANGPERVVLAHDRDAEDRQDGVADELLERAAVPVEHGRGEVEEATEQVALRLRVEPPRELGRRDDVAEEDRDRLARLLGQVERARGRRRDRRRRRGGARRLERLVVPEDRRLELLQRLARLEAQLVDQHRTGVAVRGERLGLAAGAVEREHQQEARRLA